MRHYPKMLPEPLQIYAMNGPYPDMLRVSFSDGSTQIYDLRNSATESRLKEELTRFDDVCAGKKARKNGKL